MGRGNLKSVSVSVCIDRDSKATQISTINELLLTPATTAAFLAKLSIFLLYFWIFDPDKKLRYVTYAGIAVIFAFYTTTTVLPGVLRTRRPSETWLESRDPL